MPMLKDEACLLMKMTLWSAQFRFNLQCALRLPTSLSRRSWDDLASFQVHPKQTEGIDAISIKHGSMDAFAANVGKRDFCQSPCSVSRIRRKTRGL